MIKLFRFVLALAALSCAVYWYRPGRGQYAPGPNDLGICYSDGRCRVIAFIAKGDAYGAATIKEGCGSMTSLKGPVATVCKNCTACPCYTPCEPIRKYECYTDGPWTMWCGTPPPPLDDAEEATE